MPKMLNTFTGPLVVAGVTLAPGEAAEIEQAALDRWGKGAAAAKWIEDGIVTEVKAKRGRKPKAKADDGEADDGTSGED